LYHLGDFRDHNPMKYLSPSLALAAILTAAFPAIYRQVSQQATTTPPAWAYAVAAPDYKLPADDGALRHVPGSSAAWTLTQTRDRFFAADWHPADHPPMPEVVAHGRKPDVNACGFCHRADGSGGPENANLMGLPAAYILEQMADFKSGARKSSLATLSPPKNMIATAKAVSDEDVAQAAAYFSGLKPRKLITVIESAKVPKTYVAAFVYSPREGWEKEPIGDRIIEMPKDLEQFESRDSHSEFIAYVPPGSVAKGRDLAETGGGGKTTACTTCHGRDLRGVGAIPSIAGRSPSYLMRQLYDMKYGARNGKGSAPMKLVLANLNESDLVSLAAYAASREP
jgi:cytochrome c553